MAFKKIGSLFVLFILFALALMAGSVFYHTMRINTYEQPPVRQIGNVLPSHSFAKADSNQESYPSLQLHFSPIQLNVPNLQPLLSFHGKNGREDAPKNPPELFFSLAPSKTTIAVKSGEKVFLVHDGGDFHFSPQNQPTSLWFIPTLKGVDASLRVTVQNEDGTLSEEPKSHSEFLLKEKPLPLPQPAWNIGALRADQTLLMRQGAKWAGKDLFMERHGGEEYQHTLGKERVVFKSDAGSYSIYVEPGDLFLFDTDHWRAVEKKENSTNQPLLKAVKVDDKVMSFELYSANGAQKILFSLIKQPDAVPPLNLHQDFVYVGARTKVHSLFKVSGKREIVGVGDWFLRSNSGWSKVRSAKEIDRYLDGLSEGPLLVIDEIVEKNGMKGFLATVISEKRSQAIEEFLPFSANPAPPVKEEPGVMQEGQQEEGQNTF